MNALNRRHGWMCLLLCSFWPLGSKAQSAFLFSNLDANSTLDAPVSSADGQRLSGSNFLADLQAGPSKEALQPVYLWNGTGYELLTGLPFKEGSSAGYIAGGTVVVPGIYPGQPAWLQVRAWDARLGKTYKDVENLGLGGYGQSEVFQDIGTMTFYPPGGRLYHLESFSLLPVVPEPNVAWLVALGLPWLIYRHRRKPPGKAVNPELERRKP